jgi:Probable cobalt transporter subunit (CbtB)
VEIREPGDWPFARREPDRGEDPEKEVFMERNSPGRQISLGDVPLWSWLTLALLLAVLFMLLFASGALLGQTAGVADYLHEFAHDGRHLLAVPCH